MASRGAATGLVAVSAGAPFIPTWAALVTGLVAGALFPLGAYVSRRLARLPDGSGAIPMGLIGGIMGALAVPIFADGRWGRGWNSLVLDESHLRAGQGVTGFFPVAGRGFVENGRGQSLAQLAGAGVILFTGIATGCLLYLLLTAPGRIRDRAGRSAQVNQRPEQAAPADSSLVAEESA